MIDPTGDWVHSREEDHEGAKVYRPMGHPLPPSRWRHRLELHPDGGYVDHRLGADDRSPRARGRWTVDSGLITLRPEDPGTPAHTLRVLAVEPGKLTVAG